MRPRPPRHPSRPRRGVLAATLALSTAAAGLVGTSPATGAPVDASAAASAPAAARVAAAPAPRGPQDLGPRTIVFDPSMPTEDIQARVDAIAAEQVDDEMGTNRWSLLFRPGTYGTDAEPLQVQVGYYTEVAGLGASPGDVVINGKVEV